MSTYRATRADQRTADDFLAGHMACSFCGLATDKAEPATYGARCLACYRAYCDQGRHYPSLSIAQRKAMAQRVRVALVGGLRLSGAQHIEHLAKLEAEGRATPAQRGFLAAARRPAAQVQGQEVAAAPPPAEDARTHLPVVAEAEDVPAWVLAEEGA